MHQALSRKEYSTSAVSKLIGVSCHALRIWERRYGFPIPRRSASGHRRYVHDEVNVLRSLAKLAKSGQPIGELISEYQAGRLELAEASQSTVEVQTPLVQLVDQLFAGDIAAAESMLDEMAERLLPLEFIEKIIEPALIDIGEQWFLGECSVFQEHCAAVCLFARVRRLLDRARINNCDPIRSVLVGTVQGDRHEGGVLMVSLAVELAGWRAIPLGTDLPVDEYQKAVNLWHPDALALSFVLSRNINKRFLELSRIRAIPIFLGGRSIVNHQSLARRHGLIPLTCPLSVCTNQMNREFEAWGKRHP